MADMGGFSSSSSSAHEQDCKKDRPAAHDRYWTPQKLQVPMGYRFNPTDAELILYYLFNKILDLPLPSDIIPEFDFRITDLEQLPRDKFQYWKENEVYFFACKDEEERSGFWKGVLMDENILYENNIIGLKSMYVFYTVMGEIEKKTGWIMTEFRVHPSLIHGRQNKKLKLYKIQYDPARKSLRRAA